MRIALHQPEIPANTGNIGRTCAAVGAGLDLIEPLGFRLSEKEIRRAGMDYWEQLDVRRHLNYEAFERAYREEHPAGQIWMATTKAERTYADVSYGPEDCILFGKESAGIPEEILVAHRGSCIRIPMAGGIRSLNLSNAVAIILYEALRQQDFPDLTEAGSLHRLRWED